MASTDHDLEVEVPEWTCTSLVLFRRAMLVNVKDAVRVVPSREK